MKGEKVLEVIKKYRNYLEEIRIPKKDFPHNILISWDDRMKMSVLSHCHSKLDQMEVFVKEDRMGKVFRWLGFIQGCLWCLGIYSLEELKDHNRPDESE